jgi:hypothetical protein
VADLQHHGEIADVGRLSLQLDYNSVSQTFDDRKELITAMIAMTLFFKIKGKE